LWRQWYTKGPEGKGQDLHESGTVKPVLVILDNVQIRHTYVIAHTCRIVWDVKKDECLSRTNVPILNTHPDQMGEKLGDGSGSECLRWEHEVVVSSIDHVSLQLDLGH